MDTHGPITSGFSRRLTSVAMSSSAKASRALCVRARRMITGSLFDTVREPQRAAAKHHCVPTRLNVLPRVRWVRGECVIERVEIGDSRERRPRWIVVALRTLLGQASVHG